MAKQRQKRMSLQEFKDGGFLQEANRLFFHPLGLALEILVDPESKKVTSLGGIQDYRDQETGVVFDNNILSQEKATNVKNQKQALYAARAKLFGGRNIQSIALDDNPGLKQILEDAQK